MFKFNIVNNKKYKCPISAEIKSKKIDFLSNDLEQKIIETLLDSTMLEDGTLINDNVKGTSYWLENGKAFVTYGENDEILKIHFKATIFDNGSLPNEDSMRYAKEILNAII